VSWLIYTLLAIACRASYGITSKVMTRRIDASSVAHAVLLLLLCVPISALVAPLLGGISTRGIGSQQIALLLMIASTTVGGPLYFKGIERLGAAPGQIAFSSIVVWGALLSVGVLGSHFSALQLTGALVLMGSIWLAQYEPGIRFDSAVVYILASAACYACFQVTSARVSTSITTGTYLLLAYGGPAVLTVLILAKPLARDWQRLAGKRTAAFASTFPSSALSVTYYVFTFLAYRAAPDPGVVVILLTSQVIVAVILAMVFLGERRHAKRTLLAGAIAVAAGMAIHA
jgi:drug/metabolite transporter (DMT)-like permease